MELIVSMIVGTMFWSSALEFIFGILFSIFFGIFLNLILELIVLILFGRYVWKLVVGFIACGFGGHILFFWNYFWKLYSAFKVCNSLREFSFGSFRNCVFEFAFGIYFWKLCLLSKVLTPKYWSHASR